MKTITIDFVGTTVQWDGPGTYVSKRFRGALKYHKLPEGKTPVGDTVSTIFLKEPDSYKESVSNQLWE